jgi:glycosyltransferase involved in cell wall biosynthesis
MRLRISDLELPIAIQYGEPRLSIVLPAYNEAASLRQNVESIEKVASQITSRYQIVVAEDGCTDETAKIASAISKKRPEILHLHSDHRLGKGGALKKALKASEGRVVVFMDMDLSTELSSLHDVVKLVENGYDAVIGSRYVHGSHASRPPLRSIASRIYNFTVRLLFRDSFLDHQCGFKGFDRQALKEVLEEVNENDFLFDTELILKMKRRKMRIIEIPVRWTEPNERNSRFNLLTDGIVMLFKLFKLRLTIGNET